MHDTSAKQELASRVREGVTLCVSY
jgi:hypothetical protein